MDTTRSIVERIGFALLKLTAICMTAAGVALVVPAAALWAAGAEALGVIAGDVLRLAAAFLLAGSASLYLLRTRLRWLPDGPVSRPSAGSGLNGWLLLFPVTLVALPLLMLMPLRPLAEFWRDALALADQLGLWQDIQKNSGGAGFVLLPILAVLSVPGIEVMAAAACVFGSALLLALLLLRSTRVPRALLLCVIMQGSLVLASVSGTWIIERLTPSIEQLIRETPDPAGIEQARATAVLQRYRGVTRSASETLTWAWVAMALWTPLLLFNARARATFAGSGPPQDDPAGAVVRVDPANVSAMDERARARAYVDAARQVDEATRPSRWF